MRSINEINPKIFVVEDDPFYSQFLQMHFKSMKLTNVVYFETGEDLMQELLYGKEKPFMCILDYNIDGGGMNGNEMLREIKKFDSNLPVIILSGQETLSVAVHSLRNGAYDYVIKDEYAFQKIQNLLEKINRLKSLEREERALKYMKVYFSFSIVIIVVLLIALNHYFDL
ncbi:MAG: response regulator [Cytophagales bacterium]|nr:response regulator [Cytophagales bacterium]